MLHTFIPGTRISLFLFEFWDSSEERCCLNPLLLGTCREGQWVNQFRARHCMDVRSSAAARITISHRQMRTPRVNLKYSSPLPHPVHNLLTSMGTQRTGYYKTPTICFCFRKKNTPGHVWKQMDLLEKRSSKSMAPQGWHCTTRLPPWKRMGQKNKRSDKVLCMADQATVK